jgi:ABC-type phosphate transport system permease subunit
MTTILGLTPMVAPFLAPGLFGPVEGRSAEWAPVGLVILGGLTTSTFLTVMIVPTIYSMVDDLARFCRRVVAAVGKPVRGPVREPAREPSIPSASRESF